MTRGLETTLKVLTETANEAAVATLLGAMNSTDPTIQEGALRALLDRRSMAGQRELLRRWSSLTERWKKIIGERPRRIAAAVRDAILNTDHDLCCNACDAVLWIREYDLIPALITSSEEKTNPNAELTAQTLLALAELLYEELAGPRDYQKRRDPHLVRRHVVGSLEQAVERFDQHRRRELLEAFLLLAQRDTVTLKRVLSDPRHKCYLPVVDILTRSQRAGVMRLLLSFLDDPDAPSAALNIVAHRSDATFIRHLLKKVGPEPPDAVKVNLRRVEHVRWADDDFRILNQLDQDEQYAAVGLLVASGMKRLEVFDAIKRVLLSGMVGGRRAASAALAGFGGSEANRLVLDGLADADPVVHANMVRQLRERGIPGAITRVIERLDHPDDVVRLAAQECLSEFNFQRFLGAFDMLDELIRKSTGALVMKVDPEATTLLAQELKSSTRTRRLRALEVAACMDAVAKVEALVIDMLTDSDHFIRAEAARALGMSRSALARQALRDALHDRSVAVQEAAEHALAQMDEPQADASFTPPGSQADFDSFPPAPPAPQPF